jgi:phage-related protein
MKKKYTIGYYSEQIEEEILNLPRTIAMKYAHISKLMIDYGSNLGMPYTKAISDGLFEIRLKGQEGIARVFYCTLVNQKIVMLHSFIKKTDKIPKKELEIAKKRKLEVQNG